ncbi:MAG: DUF3801 domain-containing protein [Oscillibacter sp.]|nr:DUF3801 domain-containing protein [Oscillibacter sp.]
MNPGGEAADTLVKMYLNGVETLIRLSGSFLKNLLALTMALAKDHKKVSGKINLAKMLRETRDLRTFTMTQAQYKAFKRLAKKQGILFAAVTDRDDKGKLVDVILPATELDRANLLFERILYDPNLGPQSPEPPQPEKKRWWQRIFHRREKETERDAPSDPEPMIVNEEQPPQLQNPTRPAPEALPEYWGGRWPDIPAEPPEVIIAPPPVIPLGLPVPEEVIRVKEPEAPKEPPMNREETTDGRTTPKNEGKETVTPLPPEPQTHDGPPRESGGAQPEPVRNGAPPLRPDLPDTSGKLPFPSRAGDTRTTSEKPSVLKRLAGYRAQLDEKKEQAPEKGREEKQSRGGRRVADRNARKTGVTPKPVGKGGKRLAKPVR